MTGWNQHALACKKPYIAMCDQHHSGSTQVPSTTTTCRQTTIATAKNVIPNFAGASTVWYIISILLCRYFYPHCWFKPQPLQGLLLWILLLSATPIGHNPHVTPSFLLWNHHLSHPLLHYFISTPVPDAQHLEMWIVPHSHVNMATSLEP
jgi:hypothetical protein